MREIQESGTIKPLLFQLRYAENTTFFEPKASGSDLRRDFFDLRAGKAAISKFCGNDLATISHYSRKELTGFENRLALFYCAEFMVSIASSTFGSKSYLHTVSVTELYQTGYKSRPPISDGLLYAGAYLLAGAPADLDGVWKSLK